MPYCPLSLFLNNAQGDKRQPPCLNTPDGHYNSHLAFTSNAYIIRNISLYLGTTKQKNRDGLLNRSTHSDKSPKIAIEYLLKTIRQSKKYYSYCLLELVSKVVQTISIPHVQRKCSCCGMVGHNSRTCTNSSYYTKPHHTVICFYCKGAGVIPCPLCRFQSQKRDVYKEQCIGGTYELTTFSKVEYVWKGKNLSQLCTKCGGSALLVCPYCYGLA
eukprot:jgi/Galph1/4190/GphlegSOOS_G2875.1